MQAPRAAPLHTACEHDAARPQKRVRQRRLQDAGSRAQRTQARKATGDRTSGSESPTKLTSITDTSGAFSGVRPMGLPPRPFRSVVNDCASAQRTASAASPSAVATAPRPMATRAPGPPHGTRSGDGLQTSRGSARTVPDFGDGRWSYDPDDALVSCSFQASAGAGASACAAAASAAAAAARSRKKPCSRRCASPKEPLTCAAPARVSACAMHYHGRMRTARPHRHQALRNPRRQLAHDTACEHAIHGRVSTHTARMPRHAVIILAAPGLVQRASARTMAA